ncbi:MAG TPA: hypothetical protein VN844_16070 [Pyrinomonadaceae bacterium]|nr:hypothetical protein [Pyrinomonadaceae bacterium]
MASAKRLAFEGPGSSALKSGFQSLKQACSRTIRTSGAEYLLRGRITVDAREKD